MTDEGRLDVRPERETDVPAVADLLDAAFGSDEESELVSRLRASSAHVADLALVATAGAEPVGYVTFSEVSVPGTRRPGAHLVLAPLAVAPAEQGRGVGTTLVREGLRRARSLGYESVQLHGAPGYYRRFGFRRAGALGIENPLELPDEDHQALTLRDGGLDGADGPVEYPDAFEAV